MYLQRDIEYILKKHLFGGKVLILYGPRQSGKTTLIKQILSNQEVPFRYIDCEIFENRELLTKRNTQDLFSLVKNERILFFDEAQVVPGIGSILKTLFDHHPEVQYIATGSSSFELANTVSEPLTGRSLEFTLYPFSLLEQVHTAFDGEQELSNLLRFGSYPGLIELNEEDKKVYLQTLLSQYLYRNVLAVAGVRKPEVITLLLKLLAFQIGNEVSYRELSSQLKISQQTVERYVDLLEKNFILFRLGSYARNLRNEVTRTRKVYFVDLGIRNALIDSFAPIDVLSRQDVGQLFENAMILERLKFLANQGKAYPGMYFWRTFTQQEIDYLEVENGQIQAFEFKWNAQKSRHVPPLFHKAYPEARFITVTPRNAFDFIRGETKEVIQT